mmetsp:Transcript_69016/g.179357  ORF Transcript_69016/g.179357 Transcript_69016/m.179357 type:complete len:452 (+) Transcript_69016:58-1413(+)
MGNPFSAAREEEEEYEEGEEEEEEEGGGDEEVEEESGDEGEDADREAAPAAPKCFVEEPSHVPVPKKQAPVPMDVSKLMAAAKAKAKAKAAASTPGKPAAAAKSSAAGGPEALAGQHAAEAAPEDGELPLGHYGSIWEALEDGIVRESRDAKSVRLGGVQQGECCTQLEAWRPDPTGRVRMRIRDPRRVEGWVTLDARKCRNAEGTWGTLCFQLTDRKVTDQEEGEPKGSSQPKSRRRDEIEELMDIFGAAPPPAVEARSGSDEEEDGEEHLGVGAGGKAKRRSRVSGGARRAKRAVESAASTAVAAPPPPQQAAPPTEPMLSEAQKRLRSIQKKLRDVEALEAKLKTTGSLTAEQQEKVARAWKLRQEEKGTQQEIEEEARAAKAASSGAKRRKKPTVAKQSGQPGQVKQKASSKGSTCCMLRTIFPLLLVAAGATYVLALRWEILPMPR